MKPFLRKQSISIKSLVLILLLSFIGQAWALPAVCTMTKGGMSKAVMPAADMVTIERNSTSPCHMMAIEDSAASSGAQMDCCDSPIMSDSSCSCPDDGCSASIPFSTENSTSSCLHSGQANYYSQSGFPNQINSALFRPPIA
jgi:hypothetical protein